MIKTSRRKILHVVGAMNRGGVETWLMNVTRNIDSDVFETHFLVHSSEPSAYDEEIISLGGVIHYGANPRNLLRYTTDFSQLVRRYGPFDVVHSHVFWFSGFVMRLAYEAGIPIRIAHSHSTANDAAWKVPRRLYQRLMRRWIQRYATHRIAASQPAGKALFGDQAANFNVLWLGLDFQRFAKQLSLADAKQKAGIAPTRKVIGHVGRFAAVKNHSFMLKVLEETVAKGTDAHLLLVGEGPLSSSIQSQVQSKGLADRCTFAGSQANVAPFLSAMEVFLLPSQWEGLSLVALESQAAGVPVIASTAVPHEVDVIPELIERIPLEAGSISWANAVDRRLHQQRRATGDEALVLENSRFGLAACLSALSGIYLGAAN